MKSSMHMARLGMDLQICQAGLSMHCPEVPGDFALKLDLPQQS